MHLCLPLEEPLQPEKIHSIERGHVSGVGACAGSMPGVACSAETTEGQLPPGSVLRNDQSVLGR